VLAGPGCSNNAGVVTCQIPALPRGASYVLAVAVKAPTTPGTYTNTATVSEANVDTRPSNNSVSVPVQIR
jgi:hypothetical protein